MTIERDNRVLSHMAPDMRWVHTRLEAWAPWAKDRGIAGYPRQSPTEKAALYGRLGIPQDDSRKPEPEMPATEAATDLAVRRLGDIDRRVILAYYLGWAPREALARNCGMRERQFENVLKRARWRIWGYLKALDDMV